MSNTKVRINKDESYERMGHDLLYAAEHGLLKEAINALEENHNCIEDFNSLGMNALQLAIIHFHEEVALFLVEETPVSTINKDIFGRDSLDIALMVGSKKLTRMVDEKWSKERSMKLKLEKNKVTTLHPKP